MQEETQGLYLALRNVLKPLEDKLGEQQRRHDGLTGRISDLTKTFNELEAQVGSITATDSQS